MSKAPVPQRRVGIPPSSAPQSKPQLTIEKWEAKSPLSDLALKSIAAVKAASEKTPLPLKVQSTPLLARPLTAEHIQV
jgi:conserved oligomeric Golgi complex subunit 3